MMRLSALVIALGFLASPLCAQDATAPDAAYERAAALVRDGQGEEGRRIIDSLFVRTRTGTTAHAEALYWRAALAMDSQQAERDYRRLVVEYPLFARVDRALLALAQLELARNDRERALAHLQRIEREHPAGKARGAAAFWIARIRFDMKDEPRACAALDDAQRLTPAADAELRNQIEFHAARCAGVVRPAASSVPLASSPGAPDTAAVAPRGSTSATPAAADAVRQARYAIQVAAYGTRPEADALVRRLRARNVTARVVGTAAPFRVRTGSHATPQQADAALRDLRAQGIHGFIVADVVAASP